MSTFGAVVLVRFFPAWLALSRPERNEKAALLLKIAESYPDVTSRWFDADALGHGGYTDFFFMEFKDVTRYHALWEELRDTVVFSHPYCEIVNTHFGIEDGFRAFEASS